MNLITRDIIITMVTTDKPATGKGAGRGGYRPGAGRKPMFGASVKDRTMTLPAEVIARLEAMGDGNVSAGVRELVSRYDQIVAACRMHDDDHTFAVNIQELRWMLEEWGEVAVSPTE
jgi:hypothetical protein